MRPSECIRCTYYPCAGVRHECYDVPDVSVSPEKIKVVLISESAPANAADGYYAPGNPFFEQTTVEVFRQAGSDVHSVKDIVKRGVYLTTAIKCSKADHGIPSETVRECSALLGQELKLFRRVKALLLMGDVAIKALNYVAQRETGKRAVPAGSTYKIRKAGEYFFRGMRVFPSYLQAGPSFFIEKGKHKVIAEDIAAAMRVSALG